MKHVTAAIVLFVGLSLSAAAWSQERATTSELPAALLALTPDHEVILSTAEAQEIRGEGRSFCPSTRKRRVGSPTSNVIHVFGDKNKVDLRGMVFTGVPVINILGEKNKVSLKGAVYVGIPIINVAGAKNKVKIK